MCRRAADLAAASAAHGSSGEQRATPLPSGREPAAQRTGLVLRIRRVRRRGGRAAPAGARLAGTRWLLSCPPATTSRPQARDTRLPQERGPREEAGSQHSTSAASCCVRALKARRRTASVPDARAGDHTGQGLCLRPSRAEIPLAHFTRTLQLLRQRRFGCARGARLEPSGLPARLPLPSQTISQLAVR
jgi:hypothetical protein